jgi:putative ABC transport system substrate-binding protein
LLTATVAAFAAPRSAHGQPTRARLAMLLTGSPAVVAPEHAAFAQQLADLGWIEGQNLTVDRRWTEAPERFVDLAADAVRAKPAVMLTAGPDATRAAQRATATIPIVMIASSDPRVMGVVSLARPGGNLTGLTIGRRRSRAKSGCSSVEKRCPRSPVSR